MGTIHALFVSGSSILLVTSCTQVPQADGKLVSHIVQERIAKRVHWYQGTDEDQLVQCGIELLLQNNLKLDAAVQIALLNNPQIQAHFEELGVAQADLVQAGLFQNPLFAGFVGVPNKGSFSTSTEFSVTQSFLEIFMIPLRKKIAKTEQEMTQLRVANMVLDLAFDVQKTYYRLQAEQTKLGLLKLLAEALDASNCLAHKQFQAGNINELELQSHTNKYYRATLEVAASKLKSISLRQEMNTLLGLRPLLDSWHIPNELPELPQDEMALETLENLALSQRLDLSLARLEIQRIMQMSATKEWWAYTDPSVGVSWQRDTDGAKTLGPLFSTAVPFFNHGQADQARLFALFKQSQHRLAALEIDVLAKVKMWKEEAAIHRNRILIYLNEYLPLQEKIVACSQNFYNVMGLSIYTFLQNKQHELQAKIEYTMALADYWVSRVELNRTVGGGVQK